MDPHTAVYVLFGSMLLVLLTGLPVVFGLGGISVILTYFMLGPSALGMAVSSMFGVMSNFGFIAVPLFLFMANILESSGVADDLYEMMHKWFGRIPGGLAIGTIIICTVFAAISGVSAAGIVTMGVIALPAMLKRGYDKHIAVGCVLAGGGLGQLIPPSSMMIVWALQAAESVGQMFLGGIFPGILLSALYIAYILIRCTINPRLGPPISMDERCGWREKFVALRAVILPVLLIVAVLGSLFLGITTPTEAASIGALGSVICAIIYGKLSWENVSKALYATVKVVAFVCWIVSAGMFFGSLFAAIGGQSFVLQGIQSLEVNRWIIFLGIQLIWLFLGCLMDPWAIMILSIPIFVPLITSLGFSSLWFGVMFIMNMELGFLTPPFGPNLFYMKGIVPEGIDIIDIYRSVYPFIILEAIGLAICAVFPEIVLYLPRLMFG
ncbi:MAG: TRAP transporter large permease subunit [Deltaproteobacteria bacterium]|nr:TRAP transporter large permease subunit [Deltaproteobacteria bacterium]